MTARIFVGNDQHPSVVPDMFNDTPGHVLERDEVAQPLKSFQQNQKAQLCGLSLGDTGGEIQLSLSGRIKIDQFALADATLQPWAPNPELMIMRRTHGERAIVPPNFGSNTGQQPTLTRGVEMPLSLMCGRSFARTRKNFPELLGSHREDNGVADRLNHPDRQLKCPSVKHAARRTEFVSDFFA